MAVTLTEKAATEIKRIRAESKIPDEFVLRVGVRAGGCSGWDYSFNFDDTQDTVKDFVSEQHGVKLAVDKRFDLHLDGTEIDFIDDLNRRGFKFNNPNAQKTCGCGSSFAM
jgi:iron-sulfur cluster assembly protein